MHLYSLVLLLAVACRTAPATPAPATTAALPPSATATQPVATATLSPSATPTLWPTLTAVPSPTADLRWQGLSIDELSARPYGGGLLEIEETLLKNDDFTRYLFKYPSDGLTLYGFMNVPNEGSRFPVALVLHGYMPLESYEVETYTTRYADALARAGYFVLHPNYRNHPPSDSSGDGLFRVDYAIDVLNLIAIIQEQSQDPLGALRRADAENLHLMGHSMGGGITQRVLTVWPEVVDAAVLYGSMSGDEQRNYEKIAIWAEGRREIVELSAPAEVLTAVSPIHHLGRWQTPVSIHHGTADATVPPEWSADLCQLLRDNQHPSECYEYPNAPHTFRGGADELFMERMIAFFRSH